MQCDCCSYFSYSSSYSSPPPSPCKAALKTWFISIENTARAVHHRIDPSY